MTTFISGVKKQIPKGVTFINGEKKILWQVGSLEFNSWTLTELQYPYGTSINSRYRGIEAGEDKVVYNVASYISRANVENISAPYGENTVEYGYVTYRQPDTDLTTAKFEANKYTALTTTIGSGVSSTRFYTKTLTVNRVDVLRSNLTVTASQIAKTTESGSGMATTTVGGDWFNGMITTTNYGECRLTSESGAYKVYKNVTVNSQTLVATISANGYSGTAKPTIRAFTIYDDRYYIFSAQYQAVSGGAYTYSLKKVDLSNGTISTLMDNKTTPINSILVDGSYLIVSVEDKLYKMDMAGQILKTYISPNALPTLVGKSGNFYYLTTTQEDCTMLIEVVDADTFTSDEVKVTNIKMIQTFALPYKADNGYICFSTQYFETSGAGAPSGTSAGRQASINQLGGSGSGYTNIELRICRITCY